MEKTPVACAVVGAAGRMGQRICQLLSESDEFVLAGATETRNSPHHGKRLRDVAFADTPVTISANLEDVQAPFEVIIDFTFPKVSMETVAFASRANKGAVIGTTGFSGEQMDHIRELSRTFPCVCAPNMSMGVNTLFKIVDDVARILDRKFDAEVLEIHHRHKADAPSGTALRIARILADAYGWDLEKTGVYARKGITGPRRDREIGIQTLRAGDVVGEHTVLFGGAGERLEITHRAQSRDCFARGALCAAGWISDKPFGLYDMQDVLGLRT